jgi:hypothetical protein
MFLFSLVFVFKTDSQTREVFSKNGFAVLETENLFPKQQPNRLMMFGNARSLGFQSLDNYIHQKHLYSKVIYTPIHSTSAHGSQDLIWGRKKIGLEVERKHP